MRGANLDGDKVNEKKRNLSRKEGSYSSKRMSALRTFQFSINTPSFILTIIVLLCYTFIACTRQSSQQQHDLTSEDWLIKSLQVAVADSDPNIVALAIEKLGDLQAESSLSLIIDRYRQLRTDKNVSKATARSLGKLRSSPDASLPVLAELLNNNETAVRDEAVASIGEYKQAAATYLPKLLQFHEQGHLASEYGYTVEHPPTSEALSKIGIITQDGVDLLLKEVDRHKSIVFSGVRGEELQRYTIERLLTRLTPQTEPSIQLSALEALLAIDTYTKPEAQRLLAILSQSSSAPTITVQAKASILLGRILSGHTELTEQLFNDPLRTLPTSLIKRLLELSKVYEQINKDHDQPGHPAWQKTRIDRVLFNREESDPFITAIGYLGRSWRQALDSLSPLFNCGINSENELRSIAVMQAIRIAAENGASLQDKLQECALSKNAGFSLKYIPKTLEAMGPSGLGLIERLGSKLSQQISIEERERIIWILSSTELETGQYLSESYTDAALGLPIRCTAAKKILRDGPDKSKALITLNSCLRDAIARAQKKNLSNGELSLANQAARIATSAVTTNGKGNWKSDIDRRAIIDSLLVAWEMYPPTDTYVEGTELLDTEDALHALLAAGPLPFKSSLTVLEHMYDEPGHREPVFSDFSIQAKFRFWGIVLSGADERIVSASKWLAEDPQKKPIPTNIKLEEARLLLKGLTAVIHESSNGNLRNNAVTRLDQLVRTGVGWERIDLPLLDEAHNALANLDSQEATARPRSAVDELRKQIAGDNFIKRWALAIPILWILLLVAIVILAPFHDFFQNLLMNPWVRNLGSLWLIPLLLSVFPPIRRHVLRRYLRNTKEDKEFSALASRYVVPSDDFTIESFSRSIIEHKQLFFLGSAGIGKSSYFRYLTHQYAELYGRLLPKNIVPVFLPLSRYDLSEPDAIFRAELQTLGGLSDKDLTDWYLKQGGFLIFIDGLNEVNEEAQQKVSGFVNAHRKGNLICLSSQLTHPLFDWINQVQMEGLIPEKIKEFLTRGIGEERGREMIAQFTEATYKIYAVPQDLEFAVQLFEHGKLVPQSLPDLYEMILGPVLQQWEARGRPDYPEILCERAYNMLVNKESYFDAVNPPIPSEITSDLFTKRFLIERDPHYLFRHDLIKAFLAAKFFSPRWRELLNKNNNKLNSNWLSMFRFAVLELAKTDGIEVSNDIRDFVFAVLRRKPELAAELFRWVKDFQPNLIDGWANEFMKLYGEKLLAT
jgi:HEAT repeat protein